MLRGTFTLASALSLLLFTGTAVLWVRSYRATDWVTWTPEERPYRSVRTITFRTVRGGIQIEDYCLSWTAHQHVYIFNNTPGWFSGVGEPPSSNISWTRGYSQKTDYLLGYPYDWPDLSRPPLIPSLRWYRDHQADATYTNAWRGVVVPFWLSGAVIFGLPALAVARQIRRRRRAVPGCCSCGYDLRASPTRCPECGERIAQEV